MSNISFQPLIDLKLINLVFTINFFYLVTDNLKEKNLLN